MRVLALGMVMAVLAAAGGSCDSATAKSPSGLPDAEAPTDVSEDVAKDVSLDVPPDAPPEDSHDHPPPVRSEDWWCDLEERVAACDAPLLHDGAPLPTDPNDLLYLVNREHGIPETYPGPDADLVDIPGKYRSLQNNLRLRQVAWHSPAPAGMEETFDGLPVGREGMVGYRAMFDAAQDEIGAVLYIASAYRSFATQKSLFNKYVAEEQAAGLSLEEATVLASTYSAEPGHSEHQLGTTADLVYQREDGSISSFGQATAMEMAASPQMQWVLENAHRFGIVLTYGHDKVAATQYVWEPWHWRFVGVEAADAMRRCELNTEELLSARYGVGPQGQYAGEEIILFDAFEPGLDDEAIQVVAPGESFKRTVTLANTGSTNWYGYELRPTSSPDLGGGAVALPCTPRFKGVEVELTLVAPTAPGLYQSEWWLFDAHGRDVAGPLFLPIYVPGRTAGGAPYRFVRLDDLSGVTSGADPGADIDAVVVRKAKTGTVHFAEAVGWYEAAPVDVAHDDPKAALFAPDAFTGWPEDLSVCDVEGGFVSLGGAGTLVVDVGVGLEEGDAIEVLEVGACSYGGGTAFADPLDVRVSVGPEDASTWITLGKLQGGPASLVVGFLPPLEP